MKQAHHWKRFALLLFVGVCFRSNEANAQLGNEACERARLTLLHSGATNAERIAAMNALSECTITTEAERTQRVEAIGKYVLSGEETLRVASRNLLVSMGEISQTAMDHLPALATIERRARQVVATRYALAVSPVLSAWRRSHQCGVLRVEGNTVLACYARVDTCGAQLQHLSVDFSFEADGLGAARTREWVTLGGGLCGAM